MLHAQQESGLSSASKAMGLGFLITKVIAGRAVAERSQRRELEKKYSQTAEDLKAAKEVSLERPIPESVANSIRSNSSYLEPLHPRLPPQGTLRRSRPPLERSHSEVCTRESKTSASRVHQGPPDVSARDLSKDQIRRNYSFNSVWEPESRELNMPPLPEMRGFGKYRMAVDADVDFQMNHLHRTMSDLTDQMVHHLGDFPFAGTDRGVWDKYQKLRTDSMASSTSSRSSANLSTPGGCADPKRRDSIVVRGFTPSVTSSSSSSFGDDASSHYRKDSSLSMTSVSSDGDARHRRRKGRQASLPVSDNSATNPLTTITENPDVLDKPQRKVERPCEFDSSGNNDSALASDGSDDEGAWMPEVKGGAQASRLTKEIEYSKRTATEAQTLLTRPRTQSSDRSRPRNVPKPAVDRSRTVKHALRPAFRRRNSQHRSKSRLIPSEMAKAKKKIAEEEQTVAEDVERGRPTAPGSPVLRATRVSGGSEEAKENPTDLSQYMEKVRAKHSSKGLRNNNRESEDDSASVNSNSTTKTLVPVAKKIAGALPILRKQRSATAVRIARPDVNQLPKLKVLSRSLLKRTHIRKDVQE